MAVLVCGCRDRPYVFEVLGIPRTSRVVQQTLVVDDLLLATIFETNGHCRLIVVHLPTGHQQEMSLVDSKGADALIADPTARVAYIGAANRAAVWRFDAASRTLERLRAFDHVLSDERYVWSLAVGNDGTLYAGTYPGGLLLAHDPARGTARRLATPVAGRKYVRELLVGRSGTLYCGLGTPAALAAYEPRGGSMRMLAMAAEPAFATGLRLERGRLSTADGRLSAAVADSARRLDPARSDPPVVEIDGSGHYTIRTGQRLFEGQLPLSPQQGGMGIMRLDAGPDGRVYGATYYNASLFRVEPQTGAMTPLGRVEGAAGEFCALQSLGDGRLLLPGYAGDLWVYDVRRPMSAGAPSNPWRIGEIGHSQGYAEDTDGDERQVAIVTRPTYGARGGALTVMDARSLTWRTFADLAPDQSLTAVCFGPRGRLYLGSSVEVGLGQTVTARTARFLVVDPGSGSVAASLAPVRNAGAVTALVAFDDDRVFGGTDSGALFEYRASTGRVKVVAALPHVRGLARWESEGAILGLGWRKGLFRFDPRTFDVSWIPGAPQTSMPGIVFDGRGRAYLHDGSRVVRMSRP